MTVELDSRTYSGLTVTLLWSTDTNGVSVEVNDHGETFAFPVPDADAADAFAHPFAYLYRAPKGSVSHVPADAPDVPEDDEADVTTDDGEVTV